MCDRLSDDNQGDGVELKARRRARLEGRGYYVAAGPTGREGWPFRHPTVPRAIVKVRGLRPSQSWTVIRYRDHRNRHRRP